MSLKLSETDLELDRLQAELERCGTEQKALDAQKQAIKDKMAAARLKSLLEERVFQQRAWRLLFWYDGSYRLQAYPPLDAWDEIDAILETAGTGRKVLIPLPGGITVPFRLTSGGEYGFESPDPDLVVRAVQGLGLTVVGLGVLEEDLAVQQAALERRRTALDQFRQAFPEPGVRN